MRQRFSGRSPEKAQAGLGEVIDGDFGHPPRVALVETEQTEEPAGYGAEAAISASGMVKRPLAWPARMSRSA